MFLVSACSCLCPIHWSLVLSREWRCNWSSADITGNYPAARAWRYCLMFPPYKNDIYMPVPGVSSPMENCSCLMPYRRGALLFFKGNHQISRSQGKKWLILTRIRHFWTVPPVQIHRWLWNDGQSLTWYRRYALMFFEVIHQISRSQGIKICQFWPELGVSGL